MLLSGKPLGFVASLGVLALIGIIIRNSIILMTQIDEVLGEGKDRWTAVHEATMHRARPILLTAAAASLAMIPIAREIFWGAHGLCDDRRHSGRHGADAVLSPGALRCLVPRERAAAGHVSGGESGRKSTDRVDGRGSGSSRGGVRARSMGRAVTG